MTRKLTLPTDSAVRKDVPLYSGCYTYFPAALAGVAAHSKAGNDKHNPGEALHHARGKSTDHADCIARHSMDIADMLALRERSENKYLVDDLLAEANALCWRSLAWSQEIHEKYAGAPLAPAARVTPVRVPDGLPVQGKNTVQQIHTSYCKLDPNHLGHCQAFPTFGLTHQGEWSGYRRSAPISDLSGQVPVQGHAESPGQTPAHEAEYLPRPHRHDHD